jgi:hypothetical protein
VSPFCSKRHDFLFMRCVAVSFFATHWDDFLSLLRLPFVALALEGFSSQLG